MLLTRRITLVVVRINHNLEVLSIKTRADGAVFVRNIDNRYRHQMLDNADPAEKEEADRQAEREIRESEGVLFSLFRNLKHTICSASARRRGSIRRFRAGAVVE